MKRTSLVIVVGCTGCDLAFGLGGRVETDAAAIDVAPDMPPDTPAEPCPTDGSYVTIPDAPMRSTYKIVASANKTWQFASDECRNDTETAITHLVVFDDTTELEYVKQASPSRPPGTWYAWAGYARNYVAPAFEFTSVTGIAIPRLSQLWNDMEPDNGGSSGPPETVVFFGDNIAGMIDGPWDEVHEGYVCECDGIATKDITFAIDPP